MEQRPAYKLVKIMSLILHEQGDYVMAKATAKLFSPAISCDHCVMAIVGGLKGAPGIENVSVDKDSKMVTVTYDTDFISETDIRHRMKDIGYEVVG